MRTVIILGAMIIAEAINPGFKIGGTALYFVAIVVFSSMVMDVIEFLDRKQK
jgi:hypothetical protein